jgi:hypothetical protein
MTRFLLLAGSVVAGPWAAPAHSTRTHTPACFPPDAVTTFQVAAVRELVTSTDSASIGAREFSHLRAVPDTAVTAVSDSTTCARALTAFNAVVAGGPYAQIDLVRAGTVYVASGRPDSVRELNSHIVMDSSFSVLGNFLR